MHYILHKSVMLDSPELVADAIILLVLKSISEYFNLAEWPLRRKLMFTLYYILNLLLIIITLYVLLSQ